MFRQRGSSRAPSIRVWPWFAATALLAVILPALLPPPAPFKIFVILAGVSGISRSRFLTAIIVGRSLRYFTEALLALLYGERAMTYISDNMGEVSIWLAAAIAAAGLAYVVWQRRRRLPAGVAGGE